MTTRDVARYLGVATSTVRRACANGQLIHWQTPGGHYRYKREDVVEFATTYMMATGEILERDLELDTATMS